jgi:hypothetical protein
MWHHAALTTAPVVAHRLVDEVPTEIEGREGEPPDPHV